MCPKAEFVATVTAFLRENALAADLLGIEETAFVGFPDLAAAVLFATAGLDASLTRKIYAATPDLTDINVYDINETTRRNFEPGGVAATMLFSRGVHAILAHRIAHAVWQNGDHMLALSIKSRAGRAFATDIHPAAQIGAGLWLDHGLGFVAGETCIIGEDVSIWHNVTLGSTLVDFGPQRHPTIGDGAVIGAGALVLGGITVGAGANVAAGAIVIEDVPPDTVVVGAKAKQVGAAKVSFATMNRTPT